MTRLTKLNRLKGFLQGAPKLNIAKMENVLQNYREGIVNNFRTVENAMLALSHPNMFGPKKVIEYYNKAMGVKIERNLVAKLKVNYTLRVLLFTSSASEPTGGESSRRPTRNTSPKSTPNVVCSGPGVWKSR